jgi:phosphonate transport system substrate-binding protein
MRHWMGAALLALGVAGCGNGTQAPRAEGWRGEIPELRIAVQGNEADPNMARRWTAFDAYIERVTGLPVRLFEASDYNGVIQAISSGQVDMAMMGAGGYANVDAQIGGLAAPALLIRQAEGNTGYYSMIIVRADSAAQKVEDLKGQSICYADFNSTSSYIYPRFKLRAQGFDPDGFFGKPVLAGGHIQAVLALANGQCEAAIVAASGGTPELGFTTGPMFTMARRGLVKLDDFRTVWTVGTMPNAPWVTRTDRPVEFIDLMRGALAVLPFDEPAIWDEIGQSDGGDFLAVDKRTYEEIIAMREQDIAERRGQAQAGGGE